MARPRLHPSARRDRQVNIRFTATEAQTLADHADAARLTVPLVFTPARIAATGPGRRRAGVAPRRSAPS